MAKAVPWKAMLIAAESALSILTQPNRMRVSAAKRLFRGIRFLPRILHVRNRVEFDVGELAVHHLAAADINVLDDVARRRVDRDRAARARIGLPIRQDLHRLIAVELAAGLLD